MRCFCFDFFGDFCFIGWVQFKNKNGYSNMAYLKQRGNKWYAVWEQNGKRITKATGISVKGRAEKKLALLTAEAMESTAKNTATLSAALNAVRKASETLGLGATIPTIHEYLMNHTPNGKQNNIKNYHRARDRFIAHLGINASKRLHELTPSMIRDFYQAELKRVSYGTVKQYHSMLRAAFTYAVNDDYLPSNPFSKVSLPKLATDSTPRAQERKAFTAQELSYIVNNFPEHWRELVLTSFLTGGQRMGDVVLLKWESIDLPSNLITFSTMKTQKKLSIPIHPTLRTILISKQHNNSDYVFPALAQRYSRSKGTLSCEFTTLLKAHGILEESSDATTGDRRRVPEKSFHSIRHTVVSLMRSSNLFSADVTREVVGHDSEAVERAYFSLDNSIKVQAFNYLADTIKKAGE